jgi:hypothetical protein
MAFVQNQEFRDLPSPCLWNDLLATSPAHPFIARALELIVNGIRNRFTSVDYDNLQCPNPPLNLTFYYANHYTTGSCALGAAVNDVLGRPKTALFEPGTIDEEESKSLSHSSHGKSIILQSKHKDMGTLRFTMKDENILLANRMKRAVSNWPVDYLYSAVPSGSEIKYLYGSKAIYTDARSANENIRLVVVP